MQSVSHKEFIFPVCLALPQGHLPVQDARNTSPRRRPGAQLKHTISEQLIPSSLCFRTKVTFFSKQIFQASIWQSHEQMEITPSTVIVSWIRACKVLALFFMCGVTRACHSCHRLSCHDNFQMINAATIFLPKSNRKSTPNLILCLL